jgi:hypothetical protein
MANANVARGLVPYRHFDGSVWNGSGNIYYIPSSYASNVFVGDPVDIISASNDGNGLPAVQLATSGSPFIGAVIGIASGGTSSSYTYPITRDLPIYHAASTVQYILVSDDPNLIYWIQDDASTQSRAPNLWAGRNANLVSGSGSTVTGYSGWQLQASSVNTTSTLDLKIIRPLDQADNTISSTANTNMNAKWLVKMNNYRYNWQTAGV